jgi:hypothetical protein
VYVHGKIFYKITINFIIAKFFVRKFYAVKRHYKKELTKWGNLELDTFIPDTLLNDSSWLRKKAQLYVFVERLSSYIPDRLCLRIPNRNSFRSGWSV